MIGQDGREAPYFKPEFSIDLLLAEDYLSSCLAMTPALANHLPREHVEDFASLALHLVERAERIDHIPRCVSHRVVDRCERGCRYFSRFVERRYPGAVVDAATRSVTFAPTPPSISVVIPTRDRLDLLKPCVEGIFASNHVDPEVIVLDNGSVESETLEWACGRRRRRRANSGCPSAWRVQLERIEQPRYRCLDGRRVRVLEQ